MKNIIFILLVGTIVFGFSNKETQKKDIVILKLMGRKLESAYIINDGNFLENKGQTGDMHLEGFIEKGYKVIGQSSASDAGRFSIVYTLEK